MGTLGSRLAEASGMYVKRRIAGILWNGSRLVRFVRVKYVERN